jgi:16S rRNA C967 or C1407 C5-methylase (RsmB/RsmF family)
MAMRRKKSEKKLPGSRTGKKPGGGQSQGRASKPFGRHVGAPGPAAAFRMAFATLWEKLFSSPVHLDSALSQAPQSVKSRLAPLTRLLLQRPRSLAHYLKFRLQDEEPWALSSEQLTRWTTAHAMAGRLLQAHERDAHFFAEGFPVEEDFPPAMIEEWKREHGKKAAEDLVRVLGSPPPLSLRASRLKGGRDKVLSALNDSQALPERGKISKVAPFGFWFGDYSPVLAHPHFEQGAYEIQDEGSQLMALFSLWPEEFLPMLRKVPGSCREWPKDREVPKAPGSWTVVDTCAGAGGKTLALADAMLGRGQVFAYDVSVKKLDSLRKRSVRAGLSNIKTVPVTEGAEAQVVSKFHASADRVLVDAPCTGWGVLRRNPDLKWRGEAGTAERLEALQARLLDAYCPLVKPGGILTYGLCTFRKAETSNQAEKFLERHPEFEGIGGGYFGPGPSDGFYMFSFRRKAENTDSRRKADKERNA